MYVSIDRNPENGCEIQNICCGRSGVMLKLKLVNTSEEESTSSSVTHSGLLHGTKLFLGLVEGYVNTNRIICADSYFASVEVCVELKKIGLRFIGVVKNSHSKFPMSYLSHVELKERGDISFLVSKDENTGEVDQMAFFGWIVRGDTLSPILLLWRKESPMRGLGGGRLMKVVTLRR